MDMYIRMDVHVQLTTLEPPGRLRAGRPPKIPRAGRDLLLDPVPHGPSAPIKCIHPNPSSHSCTESPHTPCLALRVQGLTLRLGSQSLPALKDTPSTTKTRAMSSLFSRGALEGEGS